MARATQHQRRFGQRRTASSSPTPTFDDDPSMSLSYHLILEEGQGWPVVVCTKDMIPFKEIGQQPSPSHVAVLSMGRLEISWVPQSKLLDFDPSVIEQLSDKPENSELKSAYEAVLGSPDKPEMPIWPDLDYWRSEYLAKTLAYKTESDTEDDDFPMTRPADKTVVDLGEEIDDDELFILSGDPMLGSTTSQSVNNAQPRTPTPHSLRMSDVHMATVNSTRELNSPRKLTPEASAPHTPHTPHTPPTKSSVAKRKWDIFKTEKLFGEEYNVKKRTGTDTPSKGGRKAKWIPDDPPPVPLPPPSELYSSDESDDDDDDDDEECDGQEPDKRDIPGLDFESAIDWGDENLVDDSNDRKAGEVISLPSSSDEEQSTIPQGLEADEGDEQEQKQDSTMVPSYRTALHTQAPRNSSNSVLSGAHIVGFDGKFTAEMQQVLRTGDYDPKISASGHGLEGITTATQRKQQLLHQSMLYDAARQHNYWDVASLASAKLQALQPWAAADAVMLAKLAYRAPSPTEEPVDRVLRAVTAMALARAYDELRDSDTYWVTLARLLREHEDLAERVYETKARMLREKRERRERGEVGEVEGEGEDDD